MAKLNFSASSIENTGNKITTADSLSSNGSSSVLYPSARAVVDFVNDTVGAASANFSDAISSRPIPYDYIVGRYNNANWDWVVYKSGWCECYGWIDFGTVSIDSAWGDALYEGGGRSLNYPVTFKNTPYEFAQANLTGGSFTEAYIRNTTTNSSTYYAVRPNKSSCNGYLYLRVCGYIA